MSAQSYSMNPPSPSSLTTASSASSLSGGCGCDSSISSGSLSQSPNPSQNAYAYPLNGGWKKHNPVSGGASRFQSFAAPLSRQRISQGDGPQQQQKQREPIDRQFSVPDQQQQQQQQSRITTEYEKERLIAKLAKEVKRLEQQLEQQSNTTQQHIDTVMGPTLPRLNLSSPVIPSISNISNGPSGPSGPISPLSTPLQTTTTNQSRYPGQSIFGSKLRIYQDNQLKNQGLRGSSDYLASAFPTVNPFSSTIGDRNPPSHFIQGQSSDYIQNRVQQFETNIAEANEAYRLIYTWMMDYLKIMNPRAIPEYDAKFRAQEVYDDVLDKYDLFKRAARSSGGQVATPSIRDFAVVYATNFLKPKLGLDFTVTPNNLPALQVQYALHNFPVPTPTSTTSSTSSTPTNTTPTKSNP